MWNIEPLATAVVPSNVMLYPLPPANVFAVRDWGWPNKRNDPARNPPLAMSSPDEVCVPGIWGFVEPPPLMVYVNANARILRHFTVEADSSVADDETEYNQRQWG